VLQAHLRGKEHADDPLLRHLATESAGVRDLKAIESVNPATSEAAHVAHELYKQSALHGVNVPNAVLTDQEAAAAAQRGFAEVAQAPPMVRGELMQFGEERGAIERRPSFGEKVATGLLAAAGPTVPGLGLREDDTLRGREFGEPLSDTDFATPVVSARETHWRRETPITVPAPIAPLGSHTALAPAPAPAGVTESDVTARASPAASVRGTRTPASTSAAAGSDGFAGISGGGPDGDKACRTTTCMLKDALLEPEEVMRAVHERTKARDEDVVVVWEENLVSPAEVPPPAELKEQQSAKAAAASRGSALSSRRGGSGGFSVAPGHRRLWSASAGNGALRNAPAAGVRSPGVNASFSHLTGLHSRSGSHARGVSSGAVVPPVEEVLRWRKSKGLQASSARFPQPGAPGAGGQHPRAAISGSGVEHSAGSATGLTDSGSPALQPQTVAEFSSPAPGRRRSSSFSASTFSSILCRNGATVADGQHQPSDSGAARELSVAKDSTAAQALLPDQGEKLRTATGQPTQPAAARSTIVGAAGLASVGTHAVGLTPPAGHGFASELPAALATQPEKGTPPVLADVVDRAISGESMASAGAAGAGMSTVQLAARDSRDATSADSQGSAFTVQSTPAEARVGAAAPILPAAAAAVAVPISHGEGVSSSAVTGAAVTISEGGTTAAAPGAVLASSAVGEGPSVEMVPLVGLEGDEVTPSALCAQEFVTAPNIVPAVASGGANCMHHPCSCLQTGGTVHPRALQPQAEFMGAVLPGAGEQRPSLSPPLALPVTAPHPAELPITVAAPDTARPQLAVAAEPGAAAATNGGIVEEVVAPLEMGDGALAPISGAPPAGEDSPLPSSVSTSTVSVRSAEVEADAIAERAAAAHARLPQVMWPQGGFGDLIPCRRGCDICRSRGRLRFVGHRTCMLKLDLSVQPTMPCGSNGSTEASVRLGGKSAPPPIPTPDESLRILSEALHAQPGGGKADGRGGTKAGFFAGGLCRGSSSDGSALQTTGVPTAAAGAGGPGNTSAAGGSGAAEGLGSALPSNGDAGSDNYTVPVGVSVSKRGYIKKKERGSYLTIACINLAAEAPCHHASDGFTDLFVVRTGTKRAIAGILKNMALQVRARCSTVLRVPATGA
jgi:hypothetical protein